MRPTKKLTISSAAVALSVVLLMLSSFLGLMELSIGAIVSLISVIIFIEVGGAYPYLVWAVSSTISLLLLPSKTIGVCYFLVFGIYPMLKACFEKLRVRALHYVVKLVYITAVLVSFIALCELVLGVPFFEDIGGYSPNVVTLIKGGTIILIYVAFFAYDMFLSVMARLYFLKWRDKFKRLFK